VYPNGQFLAEYVNSTTYFVHRDHLGSSRVLTGLDQSVSDNYDYLPYGEQLTGGNCTILRFTGQEHDSESGLDIRRPLRFLLARSLYGVSRPKCE